MSRSGIGSWTIADLWEAAADRFPDRLAQRCGARSFTWTEFDRRADGVAEGLVDAGLEQGATVAQYLYNGPEYLEVQFACSKAGLVPVNTNYRYTGPELQHLWSDAGVEAVVFHGDLVDGAAEVRPNLPEIRLWIWVDADDGSSCPDWAVPYEALAGSPPAERFRPRPRDGAELNLIYTGGTTGHPKGVMWPQDTLLRMLEDLNRAPIGEDETVRERIESLTRPGPVVLPAAPLMHGTALWYAMPALNRGGAVVTLPNRRLDVEELLDAIVENDVKGICIVGEAFARPLLEALDAEPDRWDLTGLRVIFTSGAIMRADTKERLLHHAPRAQIIDSLGSSESGGLARSAATRDGSGETAAFRVGPGTRVIGDDGRDVEPGSGQSGFIARTGHLPIGYLNDPVKTAETFVSIDGVTHVVAGDRAEVLADGTLRLLGRGSLSINTGGEKVFPEEVEEALKTHPAVRDAIVVGVPDDRFGEAVTAVVELQGDPIDPDDLKRVVREQLAGYKVPRHIVGAPIGRAANGKADYGRLRLLAVEELGLTDDRPEPT